MTNLQDTPSAADLAEARRFNAGTVLHLHRATLAQCPPCHGDCRQGRDCSAGKPARVEQWPDTIATDYGSADALGDDQAQRHSAWGALDESAARQGGKHREPSRTVSDAPGLLASLAWPLAVVLLLAAIAAGWPITWPLG